MAVVSDTKHDQLRRLASSPYAARRSQGEALGLSWDRVDWDAGTLLVDRQLQRTEGRLQLEPLKTIRSRRSLPIPEPISRRLLQHKANPDLNRLAPGSL